MSVIPITSTSTTKPASENRAVSTIPIATSSLHREGRKSVISGPFQFLLGDALLDQVVGCINGMLTACYSYDAVSRAGSKNAFFGDLNVGSANLLDFYQGTTSRA